MASLGLVLANAVIIGVETDYAARNEGMGRLPFSHALSQLFCSLADLEKTLFMPFERLHLHG